MPTIRRCACDTVRNAALRLCGGALCTSLFIECLLGHRDLIRLSSAMVQP